MGILNGYSEKDIEIMIFNNVKDMPSRGLDIFYKNTERQVKVPLSGIIDILTWEVVDDILFIRVLEIKKGVLDLQALAQGAGYYLSVSALRIGFKDVKVELVLIGSQASEAMHNITSLLNNCRAFIYDFNFTGLYFTEIPTKLNTKEELDSDLGSYKDGFLNLAEYLKNKR